MLKLRSNKYVYLTKKVVYIWSIHNTTQHCLGTSVGLVLTKVPFSIRKSYFYKQFDDNILPYFIVLTSNISTLFVYVFIFCLKFHWCIYEFLLLYYVDLWWWNWQTLKDVQVDIFSLVLCILRSKEKVKVDTRSI